MGIGPMNAERIELSVVIPTRDRRELLRRCLESLTGQSQDPGSFEVVVVDDGSSDGSSDMVESLEVPFALRALRLGRVGQSEARNAGIEASRGRTCLLLDDDVVASEELVSEHIAAHRDGGDVIGIGALTQVPPERGDWYERAFARGWQDHYDRMLEKEPSWSDCYGGNMSAPRSSLLDVGGFASDIPISKDIELGFRLCEHGCRPRYLPRAHALHDDQKSRKRLIGDVLRHGSGYLVLAERHPGMTPKLLGWFNAAGRREIALRRLLIALRVPPGVLAALGPLVPGEERKLLWYEIVWRFAFWLAVRRNVDRRRWSRLTRGSPAPEVDRTLVTGAE